MANFPKPTDFRIDPRRWAGEPDLAAVYVLVACLVAGAVILLFGAVGRI